ncbi:hypothetical protein IV203_011710 [Nitzschia inconspicua]|uniref:Uncharacterized protein n=1 Tax=Nitzschia inconspicua TaxID=303405 RepID=A0A9K3KU61_9STRA|nr:hypothetical protein IV203_011710 [Nitzschia inconspicua]
MNNKHNQLVGQTTRPTDEQNSPTRPTDGQTTRPTDEQNSPPRPTDGHTTRPTDERNSPICPTDGQTTRPTDEYNQTTRPTDEQKPPNDCTSDDVTPGVPVYPPCPCLPDDCNSDDVTPSVPVYPPCPCLPDDCTSDDVTPSVPVCRRCPCPLVTANASICPESGNCSRISEGGHPPYQHIRSSCQILKEVVSSATEAELAGTFHNGKEACPIRACLEELGHPQGPTPIVTDNSTAAGIANDTVKQKRSKAMDMRFYWIHDRVRQIQFHIIWCKGALNRADHFTKHHPAAHHRAIRSAYLHEPKSTSTNYFQCLAVDDSTKPVAQTAPKATSTDEGVCASLRHINPSSVSMGEGVLIPVRNPDITDRYKPASSAVTAGTANRHSSATRQTRRRASKRSHRQQTSS